MYKLFALDSGLPQNWGCRGVLGVHEDPIAGLFMNDLEVISLSRAFIFVIAIGVLGFEIDRVIRGAGDTKVANIRGESRGDGWMLPVSYVFGIVLGLEIETVFVGILKSLFVPAVINTLIFRMGKWKRTSRIIIEAGSNSESPGSRA